MYQNFNSNLHTLESRHLNETETSQQHCGLNFTDCLANTMYGRTEVSEVKMIGNSSQPVLPPDFKHNSGFEQYNKQSRHNSLKTKEQFKLHEALTQNWTEKSI